jgi:hypothetical protein
MVTIHLGIKRRYRQSAAAIIVGCLFHLSPFSLSPRAHCCHRRGGGGERRPLLRREPGRAPAVGVAVSAADGAAVAGGDAVGAGAGVPARRSRFDAHEVFPEPAKRTDPVAAGVAPPAQALASGAGAAEAVRGTAGGSAAMPMRAIAAARNSGCTEFFSLSLTFVRLVFAGSCFLFMVDSCQNDSCSSFKLSSSQDACHDFSVLPEFQVKTSVQSGRMFTG